MSRSVQAASGPFRAEEVVEAGIWPEIDETAENVGKIPIRIDAVSLQVYVDNQTKPSSSGI
jgi:hypothetical protein